MSYILDALNKSEQERRSNQTPGINSIHRQPIATQRKALPWLPILIVLTIINGAGIYFWLQQNSAAPAAEISQLPINSVAGKIVTLEKKTQELEIETYSLVDISDLPTSIRTEIQDLNFSTHLYGEDKDFRMVNINGVMIREGEDISAMIQLNEITELGVILKYQQNLIEVGVLSNWQEN